MSEAPMLVRKRVFIAPVVAKKGGLTGLYRASWKGFPREMARLFLSALRSTNRPVREDLWIEP